MSLLLWVAMTIVGSHWACQNMCRHKNVDTRQVRRICLGWARRSAWLQRRVSRPCVFLTRRASQFDPTIDKERKFISNLRWNMPVCAQTVQSVPLQEQPYGKSNWIADPHTNWLLQTIKLVGSDWFYVDWNSARICKWNHQLDRCCQSKALSRWFNQ